MRNQDKHPGWDQRMHDQFSQSVIAVCICILGLMAFGYISYLYPTIFFIALVLGCVVAVGYMVGHAAYYIMEADKNRTREHSSRTLVTYPIYDRDGYIVDYKYGIWLWAQDRQIMVQDCDIYGNMEEGQTLISADDDICWEEIK